MNLRHRTLLAGAVAALVLASAGLPIAAQAQASPQHGGIVFTGSSIFQFWTHLTDQMAPLPVLNRAIAGTVTQDMLDRIGQLVLPTSRASWSTTAAATTSVPVRTPVRSSSAPSGISRFFTRSRRTHFLLHLHS